MKKLFIDLGFLLLRVISWLPMSIIQVLGNIAGTIGYYNFKKRRNIGIKNLSLCFPDMTEQEKHKIIKEHFKYAKEVKCLSDGDIFDITKSKGIVQESNYDVILLTEEAIRITKSSTISDQLCWAFFLCSQPLTQTHH